MGHQFIIQRLIGFGLNTDNEIKRMDEVKKPLNFLGYVCLKTSLAFGWIMS